MHNHNGGGGSFVVASLPLSRRGCHNERKTPGAKDGGPNRPPQSNFSKHPSDILRERNSFLRPPPPLPDLLVGEEGEGPLETAAAAAAAEREALLAARPSL